MRPCNFPGRTQQRRDDAKKRQEERDKRTPEQQLAQLDALLGVGIGARKERAKLEAINTVESLAKKFNTTHSSKRKKKNKRHRNDTKGRKRNRKNTEK